MAARGVGVHRLDFAWGPQRGGAVVSVRPSLPPTGEAGARVAGWTGLGRRSR